MASLSSPIGSTIDVAARTVSSSDIRGGAGGGIPGGGGTPTIQPQSNLINVEKNLQVQIAQNVQQTQEISALRSAIDSLRIETTTLNQGLVSITNLIQQDSALEKQQAVEKAENERKLAETNVRLGKESQLEQNITNSLVTPVQALQQKVGNIFGRIGEALTTLFFGWLTNQGIEALKAASEGNKEKLEEIKNNVLKTIGFGVAGIGAIKIGFDLIIKTITGITGKIGGLVLKLATAPLKVLRSTLQAAPIIGGLFGGPKPGAKPGPKPPGGGGMLGGAKNALKGLAGPLLQGTIGTVIDIAMGEDPGRAVAGAAGGVIAAAPAAAVGGLLGPVGSFGAGIAGYSIGSGVGKDLYDKFFGKSETPAAKSSPTTPKAGDSKPEPPPTIMAPVEADAKISSPTVEPQNSMMSDSGASSSATTTAPPAAEVQPQTPAIPPPSPEMTKNFQAAWDNRNRGYARGRIESAWNNMTVEQQQQAKEWAKSTGKDWTEMKLVEKPSTVQAVPLPSAQVQPLPKPTQNVGELSEPAPNVIMMPSGQTNNQQSSISQAPTNGTDTPLISSSNPDNFYVLYSQLNYNVVM
jgi:hypothetical protein